MGSPLSVTLTEINIIRIENVVVIPLKPFIEGLLMISLIVAKTMLQMNYFSNRTTTIGISN